jgi:glycosyltransferase involved in cell wall biosynthesis
MEHFEKYSKDSRITLLQNDRNRGIAFSLNFGIQHATSKMTGIKYIARMDSDDISLKERIHTQV